MGPSMPIVVCWCWTEPGGMSNRCSGLMRQFQFAACRHWSPHTRDRQKSDPIRMAAWPRSKRSTRRIACWAAIPPACSTITTGLPNSSSGTTNSGRRSFNRVGNAPRVESSQIVQSEKCKVQNDMQRCKEPLPFCTLHFTLLTLHYSLCTTHHSRGAVPTRLNDE